MVIESSRKSWQIFPHLNHIPLTTTEQIKLKLKSRMCHAMATREKNIYPKQNNRRKTSSKQPKKKPIKYHFQFVMWRVTTHFNWKKFNERITFAANTSSTNQFHTRNGYTDEIECVEFIFCLLHISAQKKNHNSIEHQRATVPKTVWWKGILVPNLKQTTKKEEIATSLATRKYLK